MTRVVMLSKSPVDRYPPALTEARLLAEAGLDVSVITSHCAAETREYLLTGGVKRVVELGTEGSGVGGWVAFARKAWDLLKAEDSLLWIANLNAATALGPALRHRTFVLAVRELPASPVSRASVRLYGRAARAILVPERERARWLATQCGLKTLAFVLPNKPLDHPRKRHQSLPTAAAQALGDLAGRKLVLYQGRAHPERDVRGVAQAVEALGSPWLFAMMGERTSFTSKILEVAPTTRIVPHIPAPEHLRVTSWAHVGVAVYDQRCVNSTLCAPNKTWEFAGFGIPLLCSSNPPLVRDIEQGGAGVCVNSARTEDCIEALQRLDASWTAHSDAASRYFDSVDLKAELSAILHHVFVDRH